MLLVLDKNSETNGLELGKGYMRMTDRNMLIDRGWQPHLQKEKEEKEKEKEAEEEEEEGVNGEYEIKLVELEPMGLSD